MRLIHLSPEKYAERIRRNGISCRSRNGWKKPGVYAMPVLPSFFASHQWLRELKARGQRTFVAIHFLVPDTEPVLVGHFARPHLTMPVTEAADLIRNAPDPLGYELIVQRRVEPSQIAGVRAVPQIVGWRYHPTAKGRRPCGCPACVGGGGYGDRRLRDRYEADLG